MARRRQALRVLCVLYAALWLPTACDLNPRPCDPSVNMCGAAPNVTQPNTGGVPSSFGSGGKTGLGATQPGSGGTLINGAGGYAQGTGNSFGTGGTAPIGGAPPAGGAAPGSGGSTMTGAGGLPTTGAGGAPSAGATAGSAGSAGAPPIADAGVAPDAGDGGVDSGAEDARWGH